MMRAVLFAVLAFVMAGTTHAADGMAVSISGAVQHPATLTLADLQALPGTDVTITQQTGHGLVQGNFHGVLLWTLIDRAALAKDAEKNAAIRHTILVTGKDGYAAALSEGEIDPNLEGKPVILAYAKDGAPLDALRLVVPGDAHAARSVHDVAAIEVK